MSGTRGAAVRVSFLVLDAFPAPSGRRRSDPSLAPAHEAESGEAAAAVAEREVVANLRRALDGLRAHAAHKEPGPLDSIDVPAPVGGRASRREDGGEPALPGDCRTSRHQEYLRVPLT